MTDIDRTAAYKEVCENIRETDRNSFKLLSFVPLSSGVGAGGVLTLLQNSTLLNEVPRPVLAIAIVLLSLIAASIVFGLYKWELRNIQKCKWLIDRAAAMEKEGGISQYEGWGDQENDWGKKRSETLNLSNCNCRLVHSHWNDSSYQLILVPKNSFQPSLQGVVPLRTSPASSTSSPIPPSSN